MFHWNVSLVNVKTINILSIITDKTFFVHGNFIVIF